MRRVQALAAPQRGQRSQSPLPTAPLSLAGSRPAAASPFRRPVPPPSLSQSRSESQDPWSRLESLTTKSSTGRKGRRSKGRPEHEGSQFRADSQDPRSRPERENPRITALYNSRRGNGYKPRDKHDESWATLQAEVSRLRARPEGRWTEGDRSAYDSEVGGLRIEDKFRNKKPTPTPKPETQAYLFSDLVLDLGAEDAPGVRLYDEADQELWCNKWRVPSRVDSAARERLVKQIDNANSASRAYRHLQMSPALGHWHIRQADVLSIALRGGPALTAPSAPSAAQPPAVDEATQATASLLHKNGIPQVTWGDDATLLLWMDAREGNSRPQPDDLPDLNEPKYTSPGFQFHYGEFRRLLSASLASGKGLTGRTYTLEKRVHYICSDVPDRPADLNSCYSAVALIMDVEEALVMAGNRLSTRLCWTGLEHAVAGLYLEPAQHYLDLLLTSFAEALADRPDHADMVSLGVRGALRRLSRALEAAPDGVNLSPLAVLRLLTGLGVGRSDMSPSFSHLMSYEVIREKSLGIFVHILAKIGALRSLWQTWRFESRRRPGQDDGTGINPRMDIFTLALVKGRHAVLAYDLEKCQPTESPADDVQRDRDSMPTNATWRTRPLEDAWVKYPPELPFKIKDALDMDTPDDAIEEIQHLMREYPGSIDDANRVPEKAGGE